MSVLKKKGTDNEVFTKVLVMQETLIFKLDRIKCGKSTFVFLT